MQKVYDWICKQLPEVKFPRVDNELANITHVDNELANWIVEICKATPDEAKAAVAELLHDKPATAADPGLMKEVRECLLAIKVIYAKSPDGDSGWSRKVEIWWDNEGSAAKTTIADSLTSFDLPSDVRREITLDRETKSFDVYPRS